MVFPYDDGLFYMRLICYQMHVFFFLLATYLWVLYYEKPRRGVAITIGVIQAVNLTLNEVAFFAFALAPVVLIWLEGRLNRRVIRLSLWWYAVPFVMGLFMLYSLASGDAEYQRNIATASAENSANEVLWSDFIETYRYGFVTQWENGLALLEDDTNAQRAVGVALGAFLAILWQGPPAPVPNAWKRYLGLVAFGLVFIGFTYLPFMVSIYHRNLTDRVFLMPSVGATLVVMGVLMLALHLIRPARLRQVLFAAVSAGLIGVATVWAIARLEYIYNISWDEQQFLSQMAEALPDIDNEATIVLFGEREFLGRNDLLFGLWSGGREADGLHFRDAIRWMYDDPDLIARTCFFNCTHEPYGLRVVNGDVLFYENLIGLFFDGENTFILEDLPSVYDDGLYDPWRWVDTSAVPPRRSQTAFPEAARINYAARVSHVRVDFDEGEAPPLSYRLYPVRESRVWTDGETVFYLLLESGTYALDINILHFLDVRVLESLQILVNGQPLALDITRQDTMTRVRGEIPAEVIARYPYTDLTIRSLTIVPQEIGLNNDPRELGVLLDWLEITPLSDGTE
jgi:hypothetical protein